MPREQGESGEFVETIAPEDVLDVFDAVDGPVILSADVADHFGVTRETARRKLKQLSDRGVLDRRKVSRQVIYWRRDGEGLDAGDLRGDPSTTLDDTDAEQDARTSAPGDATETTPGERNAESGRTRAEGDDDPIGDILDGWEPDTEADVETARAQTRRAAGFLREHATARFTRSDLVDALADECTLGERSWWERAVQPGLRELADADLVEYRLGYHDYRWVGR